MKRSEINHAMKDALSFLEEQKLPLPPFVRWSPEQWTEKGPECDDIRENMLGWDITDFGQGNFTKTGLLLITLRNGNQKNPEKYPKPYAEKVMVVQEEQVTPMHYHWYKMEDIINRGGGNLVIKLYNSNGDAPDFTSNVHVTVDGVSKTFPAGYELVLTPGESITLHQGLYHRFWGQKGHGNVLVMEVSMCNDDKNDNNFYDRSGRFPVIEEDEAPLYYLCNEYPSADKA